MTLFNTLNIKKRPRYIRSSVQVLQTWLYLSACFDKKVILWNTYNANYIEQTIATCEFYKVLGSTERKMLEIWAIIKVEVFLLKGIVRQDPNVELTKKKWYSNNKIKSGHNMSKDQLCKLQKGGNVFHLNTLQLRLFLQLHDF